MSVSLIVVTYNSAETLSTHWSHGEWIGSEWLVVDNCSSDRSAEVATQLGATVVPQAANGGFSRACNIGARAASGEVLIFVNPDVEVTAEGIANLALRAVETGALVAPQLLNADGTMQENGRTAPSIWRKVGHMLGLKISSEGYEVRAAKGEVKVVSWVMGAALAIRRDVFESIGGWDEGFFIYYEDAEICLRAARQGIPTLLDGSVRWLHSWGRGTRNGFSWTLWKHEFASAFRFYRLYPGLLLPPRDRPAVVTGNIRL